jgi:hypothetical protein
MESRNCLAILALVTEMARQLNENISKVQLKPLDGNLCSAVRQSAPLAEVDASVA